MSKLACHKVRVVGCGAAIARISMPESVVGPIADASNLAHTLDLAAITLWSNATGHAGIRPEPFGEVCQYRDKSAGAALVFVEGISISPQTRSISFQCSRWISLVLKPANAPTASIGSTSGSMRRAASSRARVSSTVSVPGGHHQGNTKFSSTLHSRISY